MSLWKMRKENTLFFLSFTQNETFRCYLMIINYVSNSASHTDGRGAHGLASSPSSHSLISTIRGSILPRSVRFLGLEWEKWRNIYKFVSQLIKCRSIMIMKLNYSRRLKRCRCWYRLWHRRWCNGIKISACEPQSYFYNESQKLFNSLSDCPRAVGIANLNWLLIDWLID